MPSASAFISYRSSGLALCAAGALISATVAVAADRGDLSDADFVYQRERAACISGQTSQDRATCMREAEAARQEARRGQIDDDDEAQFEQNRMRGCDGLPPEDREDCVRLKSGEGSTSGSVEGGGIYRELVTPVVPTQGN